MLSRVEISFDLALIRLLYLDLDYRIFFLFQLSYQVVS